MSGGAEALYSARSPSRVMYLSKNAAAERTLWYIPSTTKAKSCCRSASWPAHRRAATRDCRSRRRSCRERRLWRGPPSRRRWPPARNTRALVAQQHHRLTLLVRPGAVQINGIGLGKLVRPLFHEFEQRFAAHFLLAFDDEPDVQRQRPHDALHRFDRLNESDQRPFGVGHSSRCPLQRRAPELIRCSANCMMRWPAVTASWERQPSSVCSGTPAWPPSSCPSTTLTVPCAAHNKAKGQAARGGRPRRLASPGGPRCSVPHTRHASAP